LDGKKSCCQWMNSIEGFSEIFFFFSRRKLKSDLEKNLECVEGINNKFNEHVR